ncbi:MAG TPA: hypothetical protein DCS38_05350, partial [Ruminococcus sp.]|nr:hypothetical protein [Ruminococcus sp.]
MNKENFMADFHNQLIKKYNIAPCDAEPWQIHDVLGNIIMDMISENWKNSRHAHLTTRRACYLSME